MRPPAWRVRSPMRESMKQLRAPKTKNQKWTRSSLRFNHHFIEGTHAETKCTRAVRIPFFRCDSWCPLCSRYVSRGKQNTDGSLTSQTQGDANPERVATKSPEMLNSPEATTCVTHSHPANNVLLDVSIEVEKHNDADLEGLEGGSDCDGSGEACGVVKVTVVGKWVA